MNSIELLNAIVNVFSMYPDTNLSIVPLFHPAPDWLVKNPCFESLEFFLNSSSRNSLEIFDSNFWYFCPFASKMEDAFRLVAGLHVNKNYLIVFEFENEIELMSDFKLVIG